MPEASALSDVVIYQYYGRAESWKLGAVADLQVGWEASRPGTLSFRVPLAQLQQLGPSSSGGLLDVDMFGVPAGPNTTGPLAVYRSDLLGKLIEYEHPTAGFWGGRITQVTHEDGMVAVGAEGYLSLLKGRRYQPQAGLDDVPLSGYLKAAIGAQSDASPKYKGMGIDKVTYTDYGDITISPAGGDLLDDVVAQAQALIPPTQVASMNMRTRELTLFAPYKTADVTLAAGRSVVGWSATGDLWAGANQVRVVTRYKDSKGRKKILPFIGFDNASQQRFGVLERDLVEVRGIRKTEQAARDRANATARQYSNDFFTFTLRLVDEDGAFAALAAGNDSQIVEATLDLGPITLGPTRTARPKVWVVARSLDVASGVMTATAVQPQTT